MDANNVVLLRGTVSSEPVLRTLPSGGVVTQVDVTTHVAGRTTSVPVAIHDRAVTVGQGDTVVVIGYVSRRFFRVGGVTQSRTEVIAVDVVKASRRRTVERALATFIDAAMSLPTEVSSAEWRHNM